jgi:Helix-turn-helix domain
MDEPTPSPRPDPDEVIGEQEVARMLGVAAATLRNWRLKNRGPVFFKAGASIRFYRRDVLAYIERSRAENARRFELAEAERRAAESAQVENVAEAGAAFERAVAEQYLRRQLDNANVTDAERERIRALLDLD